MISTIRFGKLDVHVSRKHKLAGIFDGQGESVGIIARLPRGYLSWEIFGPRKLPVEILDTVATMF